MANRWNRRAVGLLSGGLDSTLAAKLMLEQGIEVFAINFTSPFCTCTPKNTGCAAVVSAVRMLGDIPLKRVWLGDEYLQIVQNPQHGYGSGLNPCIDCRIMKIKKAGEYMHEIGASFLFTGEVLGQRPMSQQKRAMALIDRKSGLEGYILRPLSAACLKPTVPETKGWVDRSKLVGITGRSRKIQITMAAEKGISNYPCPSGGCLLTDRHFTERIRDYLSFTKHPSIKDIPLLKVGRHIRLGSGDKIIVARNEYECNQLARMVKEEDHLLRPLDFSGPTVILKGYHLGAAVENMLKYTRSFVPKRARIVHLFRAEERTIRINEIGRKHSKASPRTDK